MRWQFKEKTPLEVAIIALLFFAAILLDIALWWSIPYSSPKVPDGLHSIPLTFKGGATYFVRPSVDKACHDLDWAAGGLGVALFLLFLWHRDKIERLG
jgi:hypothetical protein